MIETREELIEWLESATRKDKGPGMSSPPNVPVCCHDEDGNIYTIDTPFKVGKMIDTTGEQETIQVLSLPLVRRACKAMTKKEVN